MNNATRIALGISLITAAPVSAANFGGGEAGMIADGPDAVTAFDLNIAASGASTPYSYINIDIAHTWAGDLTIVLEHDGVSVTLLDRLGVPESEFGQSRNLNGAYSFTDRQGASWDPYDGLATTGLDIPEGTYELNNTDGSRLRDFVGTDVHGTWTLYVTDSVAADIGFISGWSIDFFLAPSPSAVSLFGLGAIAAGRRRR